MKFMVSEVEPKDLIQAAIPSSIDFARLPGLAQAIVPIRCRHRFRGYHKDKKTGLYINPLSDANKIIYDYPGDGQGLRFNPLDGGNKDFIYRELKPGFSKFDKDGFSYKLSGRTWRPYRFDDAVKYAKGQAALMTEGEKDCEAVRTNVGLVSTTFAGGMWSVEKAIEQCLMLKNAGLSLLIYWPDDDLKGIDKANVVRYSCASVGLPCVVLNVRKFFRELPEWKPDKDGNLNGSGWGAADYFDRPFVPFDFAQGTGFAQGTISQDSFISILEDQVAEAMNQPLEAAKYPEKASSKKSKVEGSTKKQNSKASIYGQLSPEELAARKDRIANGDYWLIDFLTDKARSAVVNGSTPGTRSAYYPHLCFELWECYNYLLSVGIETTDKPESLFEEWIKNSGLCAADESHKAAWDCFNNNLTREANEKKKRYLQRLLNGDGDQGEKFELLPIASRNLPLVLANPHAPHNRGTNSWSIYKGDNEDPLVLVCGKANGEKLANHGYIVASLPDIKPTLKELKYGGFSFEAWEELKPLLMITKESGKNYYTHRPVYVVLNGKNITLEENLTRLLKLKKYYADVRIIEADNSIFDDIESFNAKYQNAMSYVEFKTSKLIRLDRKPDVLIPATKKYFPSSLIDIPSKLGILSGFCGTGKTWQIEARVRENNRRGILTVVFSKTITLKDQAAVRLKIRTVEDVCRGVPFVPFDFAQGTDFALRLRSVQAQGTDFAQGRETGRGTGAIESFSSCIDSVVKACNLLKKHGYLDKNSDNFGKFELIIDEIDETICHYAIGNETHIAKTRALAVEAFSELAINCHKLIACDANISPIIVDYLEELTKSKAFLVQHGKTAEGRKITIWDGKDPMEMFHLGLIKNLRECPDQAFSVQTLSGDFQSKWIPKNLEELILQYIADRKISIADKGTIRDPKHENFNLLSDRTNGQSKLDRRMSELSRENAIFLNNSVISTGTSIESIFEKDFIIAPPVGNPLGVFQKSLRIRYEDKETHIWLGHANYDSTYIYNSEDPNEIREHLNKMDESVRLGFLSKGDTIADIPYNQLFEDLKCRLAARENFFSRNFKEAAIALFKLWGFELVDKEDYLKSAISDQEIEDFRGNATAKRSEMSKIQQEEINQELLAKYSAKVLTDAEFEEINNKHEKKTLEEERQIIRTNFEREYEGAIECSVEEMRDYIDLKPQRLQNQFYFLNPELEHLRNVMILEKANFENNGKRDRADILRRLIRSSGYEKLRELGFDRFFYELYNIKGVTPFNNIPKIQDGDFRWIKKVVRVSGEGEIFDQIHIDLSKHGNKNWTDLCKMFVDLGAECRTLFGFTPGKTKFGIIKEFLSKFFISLTTNGKPGDSRSHFLRFDDNRDQYFKVLLNRHNQSIHSSDNPNYDLIHVLGEGYGNAITSTGQIISEAYKDDRIDKESNLAEAVRQKKILGDKPKPLFANIEGKQLGFIVTKEVVKEVKSAKKADAFERKEAIVGDYTFYNGKIAKVVGECQIGVGSLETEGFILEDLRRRTEKAPKSKIFKANPIDIANHLNGKLAKYPEDREKLLKNIQLFLPDLLDSVLSLMKVPA